MLKVLISVPLLKESPGFLSTYLKVPGDEGMFSYLQNSIVRDIMHLIFMLRYRDWYCRFPSTVVPAKVLASSRLNKAARAHQDSDAFRTMCCPTSHNTVLKK